MKKKEIVNIINSLWLHYEYDYSLMEISKDFDIDYKVVKKGIDLAHILEENELNNIFNYNDK